MENGTMASLSPPKLVDNLFSTLPPQLHPFLQLSYPINRTSSVAHARFTSLLSYSTLPGHQTLYDKGPMDLCIPITCAFLFTILRNLSMEYVFAPFARFWLMPRRRRKGSVSQSSSGASSPDTQSPEKAGGRKVNGGINGVNGINGMNGHARNGRDNRDERGLTKLARRKLEHTVTRFAEQSWSFAYCSVFWTLGVVSARA